MAVAMSLTTKQKVLVLVMAALLILTALSRVSYSKHLHGLMCAARTYHKIVSTDGALVGQSGSGGEIRAAGVTPGAPTKQELDIVDTIEDQMKKARQQRVSDQSLALRQGLYDRKLFKKLRKQKGGEQLTGSRQVLPQAIVIGVRKCGTRALLEMLEMHPQIAASGPEVHFFDKNYERGLDWYRAQMRPSLPGQLTMEKTPSYYVTDLAPERIHSMNKDAKLLVIVRDPTTRVISDYTQIASKDATRFSAENFKERVLDERGQVRMSYMAVQVSMYSNYLPGWLEYFPRSQLHFVDGDKLITDPFPEVKKVEEFLGISDFLTADKFQYNSDTGFYCLTGELNRKCLAASKGRQHPDVSPDVIRKLQDFFRPYNEKFFQQIGRRFSWP